MLSNRSKIYLIFFFSGISGLIYETVWLRILTRVLGNTVYATSVILAVFMAGLALGSYLLGRYGQKIGNKLAGYAYLEMGVAISAFVLIYIFKILTPVYQVIYSFLGQSRWLLSLGQSLIMFVLLLVPTSLMGGTLPLLAVYTRIHRFFIGERLGYLYGLNTLGAALGVLSSGLYLIGEIGETKTLLVAILVNLSVALVAYSMSDRARKNARYSEEPLARVLQSTASDTTNRNSLKSFILLAYGLSGFVAMAYEVIWTRIFQIQVGTSMYAFSAMLACYLVGIGVGSWWGGKKVVTMKNAIGVFALGQIFIALYSIAGMYIFTLFEPAFISGYLNLKNIFLVPLVLVFPITFILGLFFPVLSQAFIEKENRVCQETGQLYSINTLGCIFGSLVCGFVLIGFLGTKGTVLLLASINALIGLSFLIKAVGVGNRLVKGLVGVLVFGGLFLGFRMPDPFLSAIKKLYKKYPNPFQKIIYHKESVVASTTVTYEPPKDRHLFINGVAVTSLVFETKLMAHLPILLHTSPRDFLVICLGMGTTLRSASQYPFLNCDCVELVPEEYQCLKYFHQDGAEILKNPRVRGFVDDGRNFLLVRPKSYDVITLDPSPPTWSAGTVNLYSREFLELCRHRLKPSGVMCLWVPPAHMSEVLLILSTFKRVFPNTYVFRGLSYPGIFLVGFKSSEKIKWENLNKMDAYPEILNDLNEWSRFIGEVKILFRDLLVLTPDMVKYMVIKVPSITDDNPYVEFPLWRFTFNQKSKVFLNKRILAKWREIGEKAGEINF